jgi:transcriptional regulator with XRE-family HTH domain
MSNKIRREWQCSYMREWRQSADLKLPQMAKLVGKSISTLSKIENGKLPYGQEVLEGYAAAIGCSPADLLSRKPQDVDDLIERIRSSPTAAAALSELLKKQSADEK